MDETGAARKVFLAEKRGVRCWIPVFARQMLDGIHEPALREEPAGTRQSP